jgi:TPR repeat protein
MIEVERKRGPRLMASDGSDINAGEERLCRSRRWLCAALWLVPVLGVSRIPEVQAGAGFDEGMAAARRGRHRAAYDIWLPLAEQGDIRAQYNIGVLYDRGLGVPQNFAEATRWYRIAAERGHVDAQANLGYAYEQGRGVPQDFAQAAKWYRAAAERGDIVAQANLGTLYANGLGVEQDDVQAHMWLNLAASRTEHRGLRRNFARKRDRIAARMTPEQMREAQRLASELQPPAP